MPKTVDPILADLNPEQLAAVTHGSGPLMIVAGAGTGKTTVLTRRIAWLISEKKARPEQVLALTFSDKAAQEMEERVDRMVPYGFAPVSLSTFHAFGSRMLKEHAYRLGLNPEAEVLSGAPLKLFLKKHIFALPLKRFRPLANPDKHAEDLLKLFSRAKDEAISPEKYLEAAQAMQSLASSDALKEEAEEQLELAGAYAAYDAILHKEGFLDHGDQLLQLLRVLREHPAVLEKTRALYPWILVDEFQDTNTVQFELLKLLAPPGIQDNLTVVGDDDQAIYRFRGASLSNILEFKKAYPQAATVVITRNYRSRQDVLDCAYRLIQFNNPERLEVKEKLDKKLLAFRAPEGGGQAVFYQPFDQLTSELGALAQRIQDELASGKRAYRDFAVLVRANSGAEEVIQELNYKGIPSRFTGARGLYKQKEVKICLAFLRALARPHDNLALFDHLAGAVCRVPVSDLKELLGKSRYLNKSLYQILTRTDLTRAGEELELDPEARERVEKALLDLTRFEELASQQGLGAALYQFLNESGVISRLLSKADSEAERAVANLARFFEKIKAYDRVEKPGSYLAVVDYLESLIKEGDNPPAAEVDLDADAVAVSTVHMSKGLEWPVVFVLGLEDQHFPMPRKSDGFDLPSALFPLPEDLSLANRREERRLFYVAMTRARDELRLSFAYDQGTKKIWKRSPFLQEALSLGKDEAGFAPQKLSNPEKLARHAAPEEHPLLAHLSVAKDGEPLRLSYYPIDDYLTCPLKYKIAHALKLKPPANYAITYGNVMHQAVQELNRARMEKRPFGLDALKQAYTERWKSDGFVSREHEEERFKNGLLRLEAFYALELSGSRFPLEIESRFELRLGPLEVLSGQMDRLDIDASGEVTICDYKTSNIHDAKKAKAEVEKSLQLAIYALAYEAKEGKLPDWLELYFLESGIQERIKPDRAWLDSKRDEILTAFAGIRKSDFKAAPDFMKCKFCSYSTICPSSAVA